MSNTETHANLNGIQTSVFMHELEMRENGRYILFFLRIECGWLTCFGIFVEHKIMSAHVTCSYISWVSYIQLIWERMIEISWMDKFCNNWVSYFVPKKTTKTKQPPNRGILISWLLVIRVNVGFLQVKEHIFSKLNTPPRRSSNALDALCRIFGFFANGSICGLYFGNS